MDVDESFDGPPEVVFDVVTDPRRLQRWLPADIGVEPQTASISPAQGGGMRVAVKGTEVADGVYQVDVDPAAMAVRWQPVDGAGQSGELCVEAGAAGGSRAIVRVADAHVRDLARAALHALRAEVADHFTAG